MEDLERYADYNEYEDDIPKSKSKVLLFLKIMIATVCIGVVSFFAFRIVMFNYYPDSIENIYFTDELSAYYEATDGDIGAKTQSLRAPYDNEKSATFFADNLIIIDGIGELQVSVRYLKTLRSEMEALHGVEIGESEDSFTFMLTKNNPNYDKNMPVSEENPIHIPIPAKVTLVTDSSLTYEYVKVIFDGVDFEGVAWLSLAIYVNGSTTDVEPYRIAIYENNEAHSLFEDYELSREETP